MLLSWRSRQRLGARLKQAGAIGYSAQFRTDRRAVPAVALKLSRPLPKRSARVAFPDVQIAATASDDIHRLCVEPGGTPIVERDGATRCYPMEFGGTY